MDTRKECQNTKTNRMIRQMQITLKPILFRHVNYIKHCKLSNNVYTLIAHVYEDVRFFQLTQTTVPEITLHLFPVHVGCHKKTVITSDRILYIFTEQTTQIQGPTQKIKVYPKMKTIPIFFYNEKRTNEKKLFKSKVTDFFPNS